MLSKYYIVNKIMYKYNYGHMNPLVINNYLPQQLRCWKRFAVLSLHIIPLHHLSQVSPPFIWPSPILTTLAFTRTCILGFYYY